MTRRRAAALVVVVIAVAVFWRTAYPTITWWDSSEYTLAAGTLGVIAAPGSLLLTLLGWPFTHLPIGSSPAHVLNLLAGVLAAITVWLVYVVAVRMVRAQQAGDVELGASPIYGAALGALGFAFSATLWEHAIKFTPYILTAVFTGLILWTMLRWWEESDRSDAWHWLALLGLLFGLDFSVHRTNALLLPGALAWILLRRPQALQTARAWLGGIGSLIAGLLVQLLIMPMAAFTRSPLNFNDPSTWARFWEYVSLESRGGGFLVQFFPRNAPFWTVQVADLLRVLGDNLLHLTSSVGLLGALPAIAAVSGLVALWRNNRRLGLALAVVLFLQMAATVLYFNIPAQYFRPFDRHYLPICVTTAVLVSYGMATGVQALAQQMRTRPGILVPAAGVLAALVPPVQLISNWPGQDASRRYFTRDFAANALQTLPPNAIIFTAGDNDTFPLLYLQELEGLRRDVTVINVSLTNLPRFDAQLLRREPSFPLAMTAAEREAWAARAGTDTTLTIPVTGTTESLGLAPGTNVPKSITIHVKPRYAQMLPSEITLLDITRANNWKRPLCSLITGGQEQMLWLAPYGRPDGLFWRVVPQTQPRLDEALLRANLLSSSEYRGFADPRVRVDEFSAVIGGLYHFALQPLLAAEQGRGDRARCREDANTLNTAVPPERLAVPADMRKNVEHSCGT